MLRIRDVYPGPPDPNFSILDPGSKRFRIPDPDPHKRIKVFLTQKNSFYAIGNMIRDVCTSQTPDLDFLPIPDPGVKKHRIPDTQQ